MNKIPDDKIPEHFWSKVDVRSMDECWLWLGGTYTNGYGRFLLHRKGIPAHRMSWTLVNGEIEKGLEACHKCDVKLCVNPNHIFLGTHKENMYDAIAKGIIKNPPVRYGKDNTSSKLDENKVREIFRLFDDGWTKTDIGKEFGITKQAVSLVLRRVNWAHVRLEKEGLL